MALTEKQVKSFPRFLGTLEALRDDIGEQICNAGHEADGSLVEDLDRINQAFEIIDELHVEAREASRMRKAA